jgi:APA family basic amino acid/polyamine antiporter
MAKKQYGFWTLTFLVIANMVGAGVFTTSGFTLADLGSPHWVVAAWVVGGLIAFAGAAGYGQLARIMPESGGEYLFLSRAAHPMLGFIAGWVSLIAGFSGAIAFAAMALEGYLVPERIRPAYLPEDVVAVAVIVLAGLFHGLRPRVGAIVQNAAVLLKLGLLAAVILYAAWKLPQHVWHSHPLAEAPRQLGVMIGKFAGSLIWISLSYLGFNAAVYVADEVPDAGRVIPRSLFAGTTVVVLLYILLNAIFVHAAPATMIAGAADVAAVAAESLGGGNFASFVRVIIACALFTSVLSMMMVAPRVYAKMAEDGMLPSALRLRGDAPGAAMAAQVLIAVTIVLISSLQGLLSYLGLTLSLSAACSVACLFLPHVRTQPLLHRSHVLPALYVVCTVGAAILMTISDPKQLLGTLLTFLAGAVTYLVQRKPK